MILNTNALSAFADGDRFLADVSVTCPVNEAALVRSRELFLGPANERHLSKKLQHRVFPAIPCGERGTSVP